MLPKSIRPSSPEVRPPEDQLDFKLKDQKSK